MGGVAPLGGLMQLAGGRIQATNRQRVSLTGCANRWLRLCPLAARRGTSGFVAEAVGALGDLDQDPVGGGEVVRVEVGIEALGAGGDGVGQFGVEGGAFGGELGGAGTVGGRCR
jgi:hypothetical protein